MDRACKSLIAHAPRSSNLAALVMHVTRMLRALLPEELVSTTGAAAATATAEPPTDTVTAFSNRIAVVGKARATAGSLNLVRILVHAIVVASSSSPPSSPSTPSSASSQQHRQTLTGDAFLEECFRYKSRDTNQEQDVAVDLLEALLYFLTQCGTEGGGKLLKSIPEIYDTATFVLELLLVLLSTQLYRPMSSSFARLQEQEQENGSGSSTGFFYDLLFDQARRQLEMSRKNMRPSWTPAGLLQVCFNWQTVRPAAPPRSIQQHNAQLAEQVAAAKGEKKGPDGLYETHLVVTACSTTSSSTVTTTTVSAGAADGAPHPHIVAQHRRGSAHAILDVTKGVLVLSSTIILLPFRLMSLAMGLWAGHHQKGEYDQVHKQHLQSKTAANRTKDVLWLTESPIADLTSCLLLLFVNNERAVEGSNPFRTEIAGLADNRWDNNTTAAVGLVKNYDSNGLPDLPQEEGEPLLLARPPEPSAQERNPNALSVNFEGVFGAFGATAHTEVGALLLYTIMQASPNFREAIAVRSDLDTVVLPLLRTLYFASSSRLYTAQDYSSRASTDSSKILSIRNCPFRSQSQLYVMVILLLLFSQDTSFGADAFRRVMIQNIPWYKERNLKSISLGSIIMLSIIRSLTFNLNRLSDPFLLSNCCAVLMNLSPSIVELHDYAAMRLVSVTISCMKRYTELVQENPDDDEEELSTPTAMHGEATRTLLQVIKHCLSAKTLDRNIHLIYALVYHQADFRKILATEHPFRKSEISRIMKVLEAATKTIDESGDARTAVKALKVLSEHVEEIQKVVAERKRPEPDDFTFTYEEEADPEIFFVPYVWEIVVCVVTASSVEWNKPRIQVFPLLEERDMEIPLVEVHEQGLADPTQFSKDVSDVV